MKGSEVQIGKPIDDKRGYLVQNVLVALGVLFFLSVSLRASVGEILPTHIDPLCEDNPGPLSPLWISELSPYKQPPCSELHYYLTKPFTSEEREFRL